MTIVYYNKVGTGHRGNSPEKGQIKEALDVLASYTGNCINFQEYTGCDNWSDVDCTPNIQNYVEVTCAPDGIFDEGCWAGVGMHQGKSKFYSNLL